MLAMKAVGEKGKDFLQVKTCDYTVTVPCLYYSHHFSSKTLPPLIMVVQCPLST